MARKSSHLTLLKFWLMLHRSKPTGFTLIELLVSLLIGAIITSLLLYTVVELLQTNQREAARSDTQRDMQAALDYISQDLREAIYVYDSNCFTGANTGNGQPGPNRDQCPGLMNPNVLPASWSSNQANSTPVLAFWRVDALPDTLKAHCNTQVAAFRDTAPPQAATDAVAGVACLSQRTYTLVVYSIRTEPTNTSIWRGRARLTRYELPQFPAEQPSLPKVTQTIGWGSPVRDDGGFIIWPFSTNTSAPSNGDTRTLSPTNPPNTVAAAAPTVVVDFLDDAISTTGAETQCPSPPVTTPLQPPYVRTPGGTTPTPSGSTPRGFYVCVNGATDENNKPMINQNQEVVVYLRGNAAGRSGVPRNGNLLIPMETRVMTRGALQKPGS